MLGHRTARNPAAAMFLTLSRTALPACALFAPVTSGQTNTPDATTPRDAAEKNTCIRNLKVVAQAISAYERAHTNLPNWLSDLVPQYLSEVQVLTCPVARRTGHTEEAQLGDPKVASSYLFEFGQRCRSVPACHYSRMT